MHVGVYDCMRSESESKLCHQLSGILRKASNQTFILVCRWKYVSMERIIVTLVTTATQACASDLCMCVHVCVLALFR